MEVALGRSHRSHEAREVWQGRISESDMMMLVKGDTARLRGHQKGSYLQMGMAVGTGKATARVYEDPRHPGPGRGCCGNGGNDGLPELN